MKDGYIITGNQQSNGNQNISLIKIDNKGTIAWSQSIGGPQTEWSNDVNQTKDGGFIIVGNTNSKGSGDNDLYLVKTDAKGVKVLG